MDAKEAISQLESLKEHCEDFKETKEEGCIWRKDIKSLEIAVEALEKEVPRKPKVQHINGHTTGTCDICSEKVNEDDYYCKYCGQKIDWE